MGGSVDRFGTLLLDASLVAAVLSGLIALAMVGCRQPARRCVLARAGLFASMAIWPLVALAPAQRIDLIRPVRWILTPQAILRSPAAPTATAERGAPIRTLGHWNGPAVRLAGWAARGLVVVYASVIASGMAWLVLGWWGAHWLTRRSASPSRAAEVIYASLAPSRPLRAPRLLVAPRIARPVLLGMLRPAILIPAELDRPQASAQLRLSLLHELAHAERGDAAFLMVGNLAQVLWFFLPPVWWIRSQMSLDQEFLADHHASHGFGHSAIYASSLVELAAPATAGEGRLRAATPQKRTAGAGSMLFLRVLMLVRCPFPVETRAPAWWRWSLGALIACGTLVASTFSLRSAEPSAMPAPVPASGQRHGSFHLVRLITEADPEGHPHLPPQPCVLPPLLPASFDLALDVWATASELNQIRIIGYRVLPDQKVAAGWHTITVHRDLRGTSCRLDGQAVRSAADPGAPPRRLTVTPAPRQAGLFRNLTLRW